LIDSSHAPAACRRLHPKLDSTIGGARFHVLDDLLNIGLGRSLRAPHEGESEQTKRYGSEREHHTDNDPEPEWRPSIRTGAYPNREARHTVNCDKAEPDRHKRLHRAAKDKLPCEVSPASRNGKTTTEDRGKGVPQAPMRPAEEDAIDRD